MYNKKKTAAKKKKKITRMTLSRNNVCYQNCAKLGKNCKKMQRNDEEGHARKAQGLLAILGDR